MTCKVAAAHLVVQLKFHGGTSPLGLSMFRRNGCFLLTRINTRPNCISQLMELYQTIGNSRWLTLKRFLPILSEQVLSRVPGVVPVLVNSQELLKEWKQLFEMIQERPVR